MAGFRKIYTSGNEYLEDVASSSKYFDAEQYEKQKESGTGLQYLNLIASYKDQIPSSFDDAFYDRLSSDEKLNYFAFKTTMTDTESEDYKANEQYFNTRKEQIKNEDIFNGLSDVEKVFNTGVGLVGNLGLQIGGILEGLIDTGSFLLQGAYTALGNKEMADFYKQNIKADNTGYNTAQEVMNTYLNQYTFVDKNIILQGINDIGTGIIRMAPMLIPGTGPLGSITYYLSMAGNTAQEAIKANPDINYGNLFGYVAGSVGLEAGTEFISGKIFDGDTIAKLAFGGKGGGTGSLLKDIGLNFVSEGLEEATSELFGSMLHKSLVDQNADIASIEDIIYAAVIGGLTGSILTGGKALFGTTRYSVTKDGKLIQTKDAPKDAKKLGLSKSYSLVKLLQEVSQNAENIDEVTKLKAKYGESLDSIIAKHGSEYQKALAKDTETKQKQANAILDLANLMNTIGVEQFQRSSKYLEASLSEAQQRVDNYLNHTDVVNKVASAVFTANNPGKSWTPTVTTNDEQALTKVLREIVPGLHVSFGQSGSEDGTPVRYINSNGSDWLFIESGTINTMGYDGLMSHAINFVIKDGLVQQLDKLNVELGGVIDMAFKEKRFKDLSLEDKQGFAERILFDTVFNKRVFLSDKKVHSQIFNYLTKETEKVRKFGRKTDANKVKFNNLLQIRNKFLNSIAELIGTDEDYTAAQSVYQLSDDELKTKIIDKSTTTILNNKHRLMNINHAQQSISRTEAMNDLLNNRVETDKNVEFDWTKVYDETYYNKDWVAQLKQKAATNDFGEALRDYIATAYGTELNINARDIILNTVVNQMADDELNKTAESLLTKEYLDSVTNQTDLQIAVANTLFNLSQDQNLGVNKNADSVVVSDSSVEGTGKIKFLKVKYDERIDVYNDRQERELSESAGEQTQSVVTRPKVIGNRVSINQIDEESYNDRQREMVRHAAREYGARLHFYSGDATLTTNNTVITEGLNGFVYDITDIYLRYDETTKDADVETVLLHEGTHILISNNMNLFFDKMKQLINVINSNDDLFAEKSSWDIYIDEYSSPELYGNIYDRELDIAEELFVDFMTGLKFIGDNRFSTINNNIADIAHEFYTQAKDIRTDKPIRYGTKQRTLETATLTSHETADKASTTWFDDKYAAWSQETLDELLDGRYANKEHPNHTNAYVAYINPVDFVANSTIGARERTSVRKGLTESDPKKRSDDNYDYWNNFNKQMRDEGGVPRFWVDLDTMTITGHEGRHRNYTFDIHGITKAPVLLIINNNTKLSNEQLNKIYRNVAFKGQPSDLGDIDSPDNVLFGTLVPLNESHRNDLESMFVKGYLGEPKLRFSKEIKQPNITDTDIKQLASTNYKTGEIRKSTAKGFEDVEYEKASVMDYELQNYALLSKIKTLDDLKTVLEAISNGEISRPESTFLLDLIQERVIPLIFKGEQSAKDLLKKHLAARTTETAQELAARSELFGKTHAVESFVKELSEKTGTPVELSDKLITKWVPYYADRTNYLTKIKAEYDELLDLRKNAKDPYLIQQYTLQLKELGELARMVSDGNTAAVLDYTIRKLQDAETNKTENNEKIMEITRDIVAELVSHTNMNTPKPTYDPNKKYTLSPEHAAKVAAYWETINSFRYLAMLSSPTTWGRNALTNTLISLNAIVEDATSKNIEKTNFLRAESQANYTGDYDDNFAKFVEEEYSARIDKDTKGDKYHEKELDAIRQEYAQENDPLKKHEYLYKIKQFEQKMLNDQPWTKRRVMRNLKGTLAGSINMISNAAYSEIKGMYRGDTPAEILANMRKTNSALADLFEQVYITNKGNDMIGTIQLASKLNKTSPILDSIYNNALHRGNELLFKTDNFLTKAIGKLNKSHPMAAAFVSLFVPFARTSSNTTMYIINHSPIGIAKGIVQSLQTRNMYVGEMRNAIKQYYKDQYISQHKDANKDLNFDENAFSEWMSKNLSSEQLAAINGDYNAIKSVFNALSEEGKVNNSVIGSNNMFARATAIESLTQGLNGTAWMALGLILASMIKGFKIDDDDYLGPVLTIGDIKWKLSDLSPFATMFSVGAVINSSDNVVDGFENFFKILIDESMLNVVESALQYSDSIPDYLGNQSINIVQQYIPAVFKNITKVIDNGKKDKSGNYFEKLLKTTISNLPLFSYLVANKIDPYTGETQKIYRSGLLESLFNQISPVGFRTTAMSDTERDMRALGVETTGLTGRFTVNDKDYTVKDKQKYAKYRADYIEKQYNLIVSGKQSVTVEDDKGNRITTTYNKLTDKQKKNVINRLYTEATNMTKIKWWLDSGNSYIVTSRDLYNEYRSLYDTNKIIYKKTWSKSKFVEA